MGGPPDPQPLPRRRRRRSGAWSSWSVRRRRSGCWRKRTPSSRGARPRERRRPPRSPAPRSRTPYAASSSTARPRSQVCGAGWTAACRGGRGCGSWRASPGRGCPSGQVQGSGVGPWRVGRRLTACPLPPPPGALPDALPSRESQEPPGGAAGGKREPARAGGGQRGGAHHRGRHRCPQVGAGWDCRRGEGRGPGPPAA